MHHSYFWEFSQKKVRTEITRGYAASSNPTVLQGFVRNERVSFQSQQGLRFVLRVQPDKSGFELYVASRKNIHFLTDSEGTPRDLTALFSFPVEDMGLTENVFPEGVYECEIVNRENQSSLSSYLSLKKLKAGTFYFRLTEVLYLYTTPDAIHTVRPQGGKYDEMYLDTLPYILPTWDVMWTWQMRLEYLRYISVVNTNPHVRTILNDDSEFLQFGVTPSQVQNFARSCFQNNRAVLMKERTGLYGISNWQGTPSRTGTFRSVLFRSLSEIYILTDPSFIPNLKSDSINPIFLDKVRLAKAFYPSKPTKKHGLLPDKILVESLATKESYEVAQIPVDIRKRFLNSDPFLENIVHGWVERESNLSRSEPHLVSLIENLGMQI